MSLKKFFSSLSAALLLLLAAVIWKPGSGPIPTPSPTPTVSPQPTVFPTAFPTPSAAATPSPTVSQCTLTESTGKCEDNPSTAGIYSLAVASAQQKVADSGLYVDASGKVVNEGAYTAEVANKLRAVGYCAANKLADEVVVKIDNNLSETYDIVTGSGDVWRKFVYRCVPAGF